MVDNSYVNNKINKPDVNQYPKKSYLADPTFIGIILVILLLFFGLFLGTPKGLLRFKDIDVYHLAEKLFKILMATVIGGLVGIERGNKNRPAGLRTHALVSVGACVVMIISFELFDRFHELANFDPARLGAQVISGIGFLGAGTIMRNGMTVKGLTTAASLWVVACVGLAIGSGLYIEGITVAMVVFFALHALANFELRHEIKSTDSLLKVYTIDEAGQVGRITSLIGDYNIQIKDLKIIREDLEDYDNVVSIELKLGIPYCLNMKTILNRLSAIDQVVEVEF